MDISDFDFELPEKLIAQHPPEVRGSSRLLVALPTLPIEDKHFGDLPDYVAPGDVLVFNNTKVMKRTPVRPKSQRRQNRSPN